MGHACMFVDFAAEAGSAERGSSSTSKARARVERFVSESEALVVKCQVSYVSERKWLADACRRMFEAYMAEALRLRARAIDAQHASQHADTKKEDAKKQQCEKKNKNALKVEVVSRHTVACELPEM